MLVGGEGSHMFPLFVCLLVLIWCEMHYFSSFCLHACFVPPPSEQRWDKPTVSWFVTEHLHENIGRRLPLHPLSSAVSENWASLQFRWSRLTAWICSQTLSECCCSLKPLCCSVTLTWGLPESGLTHSFTFFLLENKTCFHWAAGLRCFTSCLFWSVHFFS